MLSRQFHGGMNPKGNAVVNLVCQKLRCTLFRPDGLWEELIPAPRQAESNV